MPRETQRYETKSTPHFSSWPFQSEDGLPQSTQTSRLNPSSLFEQRPDKACLAESAPGPSGHGNGRIHWAMGAGEVCCLGLSCVRPVADGIGCCVRVFFLALMYLCPSFVVLCLVEDG